MRSPEARWRGWAPGGLLATWALLWLIAAAVPSARGAAALELPARLSDGEFWRMVEDFSEPSGFFQSENLVGNEKPLQHVVPALRAMKRGGAYVGVAPDQNFTYIVALEPGIAFIVDIRRGNLLEHLMYKAIIELSPTRADFLARLFSRKRPDNLDEDTPVGGLFEAFWPVAGDPALFEEHLEAVEHQLTTVHGFRLSREDLNGLAVIYEMFYRHGPSLRYSLDGGGRMPSYADMLMSTDLEGKSRSYLATEENYRALKAFQEKNLLVPVVGDFAGPKALRAVGAYLARHGAIVRAFYTSNVEQYLFRNAVADAFYRNVETLPIDDTSVFIRSASQRNLIDPMARFLQDFRDDQIKVYVDVTGRGTIR